MKRLIKKKIREIKSLSPIYNWLREVKYVYSTRKYLIKKERDRLNVLIKPVVINLNANDICNSKCQMCNIWQQKKDIEISSTDLEKILKNELYSDVVAVGITGGEPTLRADLVDLYKSCIVSLPNLKGLSIITNAILQDEVIRRIEEVNELCQLHNKSFSMMVSLDGYQEMHDNIRGRVGNFKSAVTVIDYFLSKGFAVETGTTISKENVWNVDELLFFLKKKNWYGRFRIAEFINRLYNQDKVEVIRNYTDDEIYQLTLFFYKLIFTFEKNEIYQRTYYNIIGMLNGEERLIGCPYQTNAINLNSRGELAYCAPKSPIIGNAIEDDSMDIYRNNLDVRNNIIKKDCSQCIHDYHAELTLKEFDIFYERDKWKKKINVNNSSIISVKGPVNKSKANNSVVKVFIIGWYGTETVGDKAILGGIIDDLKSIYSNLSIVIGSIFPYITQRTIKELNIDAHIVDVYSADFTHYSANSDIVVMGGGPLMDLDELAIPLHAFRIANRYNKKTIVYGCGIGPLHYERNSDVVKEILRLSSTIYLRDKSSVQKAFSYGFHEAILTGDYAKRYLQNHYSLQSNGEKGLISCYLREWTSEYSEDKNQEVFCIQKELFENALASFIKEQAVVKNAKEIRFQNMHNFIVGNDDRDFSRYFIAKYFQDFEVCKVTYDEKLASVDSIVGEMQKSELNICMRFHSVLFAHTLNTDFWAIDYTLGGKINNYLSDHNEQKRIISISQLIEKYENSSH